MLYRKHHLKRGIVVEDAVIALMEPPNPNGKKKEKL
jgi:hypothetical protein